MSLIMFSLVYCHSRDGLTVCNPTYRSRFSFQWTWFTGISVIPFRRMNVIDIFRTCYRN